MSIPKLELISHHLCPYVQRAIITLLEKNIPFERSYIDLSNKPNWFCQISPLGKVPLLKVDGKILFESTVICEYIDEITPGSLHPPDPFQKAQHRAWIEFGNSILNTIAGLYNAPNDDIFHQKCNELLKKFIWIDQFLIYDGYFAGEKFSMVDCVYGPIFRYFDVLDDISNFDFFIETQRVKNWRNLLRIRSSIQYAVNEDYEQCLHIFIEGRKSYLSKIM
jgi:glutathione S-transferase